MSECWECQSFWTCPSSANLAKVVWPLFANFYQRVMTRGLFLTVPAHSFFWSFSPPWSTCARLWHLCREATFLFVWQNVINHTLYLHFVSNVKIFTVERFHYNALQLELRPLWTCGPPLSEAKSILQAGFSAVKCHYLGHMPQLKKLPGATPSSWQRGVPPVTQSCRPLWHHARITLIHFCICEGCVLCLLQCISPLYLFK